MELMNLNNMNADEMALLQEQLMVRRVKSLESQNKEIVIKVNEISGAVEKVMKDNEVLVKNQDILIDDLNKIKKESNVLAIRNDLASILKESIQKKAFSYTGNRGTVRYILLYRKYISDIYRLLKEKFQVARYDRISVDDFDEAKNIVKTWFPKKYLLTRIINDYQKQYDNNTLPQNIRTAFEILMDEIGGDICNLMKNN